MKKQAQKNDMIKNVRHSTENALTALKQLENALVKGRFEEGVKPYHLMCNTLLGQRVWSLDKEDEIIHKNFDELSRVAARIINIFQPYVQSLEKLAQFSKDHRERVHPEISDNNIIPVKEKCLDTNEELVLKILKREKRQISFTKLRADAKLEKKKLEHLLLKLQSESKILISENRGRKLISCSR